MYVDGCEYWENKFNNWKICVDLGYLEYECASCTRNEKCMIQQIKTEEMEKNKNEFRK